jgi:hypothetical protein
MEKLLGYVPVEYVGLLQNGSLWIAVFCKINNGIVFWNYIKSPLASTVNVFLRSNTCSNVFAFERKVENTFPLGVQTFFWPFFYSFQVQTYVPNFIYKSVGRYWQKCSHLFHNLAWTSNCYAHCERIIMVWKEQNAWKWHWKQYFNV